MAKDERPNRNKQRLGTTPNSPGQQKPADETEWNEAELEADARAKAQASMDSLPHRDGFFEKAKHVIHNTLHRDEPEHLAHATAPIEDPVKAEEIREAHKVDLGPDGADLKGMPINKVPGKLRKFVSNN